MNRLDKFSTSRLLDFLLISDDTATIPLPHSKKTDLFIGKNKSVTLTLKNGSCTELRDVVVLGQLTIRATDIKNTGQQPCLFIRHYFNASQSSLKNVNIHCQYFIPVKNRQQFRTDLLEIFLERMNFRRDAVATIGLKSILI